MRPQRTNSSIVSAHKHTCPSYLNLQSRLQLLELLCIVIKTVGEFNATSSLHYGTLKTTLWVKDHLTDLNHISSGDSIRLLQMCVFVRTVKDPGLYTLDGISRFIRTSRTGLPWCLQCVMTSPPFFVKWTLRPTCTSLSFWQDHLRVQFLP